MELLKVGVSNFAGGTYMSSGSSFVGHILSPTMRDISHDLGNI